MAAYESAADRQSVTELLLQSGVRLELVGVDVLELLDEDLRQVGAAPMAQRVARTTRPSKANDRTTRSIPPHWFMRPISSWWISPGFTGRTGDTSFA